MTLTEYITKNKVDRREFAKLLGVDPLTLYRWETGRRFPRKDILRIMEVTKNKVTANDFFVSAS
jgi:DNA-binding transcriptional regulator YiaG